MADRRIFPERTLLSVEYPGYVVDTDKAIRSIGGSKKLARDTTEDVGMPIELRYRYNDPTSHPINGEIISTENLLLKVKRRVRRPKGKDDTSTHEKRTSSTAEIVAVLDKTVRFRKLADFQYLMTKDDPLSQFSDALTNINVDELKKLGASEVFDKSIDMGAVHVPAPFIDYTGWPSQYRAVSGRELSKSNEAHVPEDPTHKLRNPRQKADLNIRYIKFATDPAPVRPMPDVEKDRDLMPPHIAKKVEDILAETPVVSRNVMEVLMPTEECDGLRTFAYMPIYAYLMEGGPWRSCWIRFGYDPRTDPEACKYQILGIRRSNLNMSSVRPRLFSRSGVRKPQPPEAARIVRNMDSYIFDDKTVEESIGGVFQLMHIQVQPIRDLIDYPKGRRKVCCERSGWLQPSVLKLMRNKVRLLKQIYEGSDKAAQELPVDYAELDKAIKADREKEEHMLATQRLIAEREQATSLNTSSDQPSQDVREHVNARVDQFMQILGTQGDSNAMEGNDSERSASDADEFDIFGYDDDDDA
ncbi:tau 95 subunit of transcription factor TFIIIC [Coemansia sp. RSA 988]|nr:tau 95 subunit of transcription factor TFIIIC [Coemansia sp. RSA 988]